MLNNGGWNIGYLGEVLDHETIQWIQYKVMPSVVQGEDKLKQGNSNDGSFTINNTYWSISPCNDIGTHFGRKFGSWKFQNK